MKISGVVIPLLIVELFASMILSGELDATVLALMFLNHNVKPWACVEQTRCLDVEYNRFFLLFTRKPILTYGTK